MQADNLRAVWLVVSLSLNGTTRQTAHKLQLTAALCKKGKYELMRHDEIFASDCLREHLGSSAQYSAGEDPPDCYFEHNGVKIAVEITQLRPISFDEKGSVKNATSEDEKTFHFIEQLNSEYETLIPEMYYLILAVVGPLRHPKQFKRSLKTILRNLFDSTGFAKPYRISYFIAENEVRIAVRKKLHPYSKAVVGGVYNQDKNPFLNKNASVMLQSQILKKAEIMSKIKWQGPQWLILINADPLLGAENYRQSFANLEIEHHFSKVWLVSPDRSVCELHEYA